MCDFASFFVGCGGEIAYHDWCSHSATAEKRGLVLDARELWSECEWTDAGLVVRHTDADEARRRRSSILARWPERSDFLRAHGVMVVHTQAEADALPAEIEGTVYCTMVAVR